jgi:hypothetical protein
VKRPVLVAAHVGVWTTSSPVMVIEMFTEQPLAKGSKWQNDKERKVTSKVWYQNHIVRYSAIISSPDFRIIRFE